MAICGWAQAQAVWNVKAPGLAVVQKTLDNRSEVEGRNFLALVVPAQKDFFAVADRHEEGGYETYTLHVKAEEAMAARMVEACNDLESTGKTIFGNV